MTTPILAAEHLCKSYDTMEILKDINISINAGDFLVLVGPSGCGKSTLLNCIAGLEDISGGTLSIGGRDMAGVRPKDRDIAMVFQSHALYPTMTVAKNITFGLKVRGADANTQKNKLDEVANLLQIVPLLKRKPGQLSGGQRQRVAMGRALVRAPKLFLFDEPLSNLDAKLRVDMRTEIKKLHQTLNASIVYVTHDQIEAMTLATKIVVMNGGVVQQIGSPAEIYQRPANMFVADFMGSPSMNLIPARVTPGLTSAEIEILRPDNTPIILKNCGNLGNISAPKHLLLGLPPEHITTPTTTDNDRNQMADCLIDVVEPAGADTYVVTQLGGIPVTERLKADTEVSTGMQLRLAFGLDKASCFDADSGSRLN